MLVPLSRTKDILRYPGQLSRTIVLEWTGMNLLSARSDDENLLIVANQPVLIDFRKSLIQRDWLAATRQNISVIGERQNIPRKIKGLLTGTRQASAKNIRYLGSLLKQKNPQPLLLMVGAGGMGMGCETLYEDPAIAQLAFDIYPSRLTQLVADAHQIPLCNESVDGVVVQAVLEHVLDPAAVAAEIFRVLKPGGLVYAETPFMQQVHEGAYDFTRFTELGHRWLWRHFDEVYRDVIGGPGLSLYWSACYFWRAMLRHRRFADAMSSPFLLFALLDRFLPLARKIDGANGVCFLGKKGDRPLQSRELISQYLGQNR
jgi:SAM-dependent methyltransferase